MVPSIYLSILMTQMGAQNVKCVHIKWVDSILSCGKTTYWHSEEPSLEFQLSLITFFVDLCITCEKCMKRTHKREVICSYPLGCTYVSVLKNYSTDVVEILYIWRRKLH